MKAIFFRGIRCVHVRRRDDRQFLDGLFEFLGEFQHRVGVRRLIIPFSLVGVELLTSGPMPQHEHPEPAQVYRVALLEMVRHLRLEHVQNDLDGGALHSCFFGNGRQKLIALDLHGMWRCLIL